MTTKITIRFNDGKAANKRALTYLQTVGISYPNYGGKEPAVETST